MRRTKQWKLRDVQQQATGTALRMVDLDTLRDLFIRLRDRIEALENRVSVIESKLP
jgi:BMFP domain-containing protein YqiC